MASYEVRTNKDRSQSHRVRFRHLGKNEARTFDSAAEAQRFKAAVEVAGPEQALALLDSAKPVGVAALRTVAAQVADHIDHLTGIEDGTRRRYRKLAAARIDDSALGRTLLTALTRADVARWVNAQTGAPKTIKNVAHGVLSPAIDSAVRDGLIPANPAKGVPLPKRDQDAGEHVYLEAPEFATLLDLLCDPAPGVRAAKRARWRPLVLFLAGTGVRFSEATALTIADLHLEVVDARTGAPSPQARIRQAWKETNGGPAKLGPPKTKMSRRTIAIPAALLPGLRELVADRDAKDFVFVNSRGNPIFNGPFHESAWQPVMPAFERATGKRPRPHDLRHTYASWAIRSGTPLPVIQRQMGHESIQVTVDTYGHLVRSDLDALAASIGTSLPELEG